MILSKKKIFYNQSDKNRDKGQKRWYNDCRQPKEVNGLGWILDVLFFVILISGIAVGAKRGFADGVCKLLGKFASLLFAFALCVSFANLLESWFHMTTAIANGIGGALAGKEALNIGLPETVSGAEIGAALDAMGVSGIEKWFITTFFKDVAAIPAGTTAAVMIGTILAKWISIAIAFLALLILVRLAAELLSKLLTLVTNALAPLRILNQALGAVLGLAKACVLIFLLLLVCNWLPIEGLHAFISSSTVVGGIFNAEWFKSATSYAISGQWFADYIAGMLPQ